MQTNIKKLLIIFLLLIVVIIIAILVFIKNSNNLINTTQSVSGETLEGVGLIESGADKQNDILLETMSSIEGKYDHDEYQKNMEL